MLLRYVLLSLNFLVAASVPDSLVRGWAPGQMSKKGFVYWMMHKMPWENGAYYQPFVLIESVGRQDRFLRMSDMITSDPRYSISDHPDIRHASEYFGENVWMKVAPEKTVNLNTYFVFPREKYVREADPEVMRIWHEHITSLSEESLDRLIAAADFLVYGWSEVIPLLDPGLVYWFLPRDLGYKGYRTGTYVPCVLINCNGAKCIVVCMYKVREGVPALQFFGTGVMLKTPWKHEPEVNLDDFHLFPGESHTVIADSKVMQLWNWEKTQMPLAKLEELEKIVKEEKEKKKKAELKRLMRNHRRELGF